MTHSGQTRAQQLLGDTAPELVRLTDEVLFGQVWADPALSPRDRSLVTVAALTSLYRTDQLRSHLRRALDNGLSKDELVSAITHLAFYAGWPNAMSAITELKKITEEDLRMSSTSEQNTRPVAVITGASSGIGEATARALAASGYRLALLARRADRIKALAGELGNGSIAIPADVTDRDSIVRAAGQVKAELGGTDVLVNNAGIMLLAPFNDEGHDDHRRMVEANLLGAITVTEVFLDQLRDGGGDLVNLSSVAGRTARPGNAVYAATKWGLNGWSESLRQELQPGVRVMVIEPGAVATELTDHITNPEARQGAEKMYQQLAITADDIAEVIAFAVTRPRRMTLNEILVRPTAQP